jgi:hypothetical protein
MWPIPRPLRGLLLLVAVFGGITLALPFPTSPESDRGVESEPQPADPASAEVEAEGAALPRIVELVCPLRFAVQVGEATAQIPYCSNASLDAPNQVTRAIVVVHGSGRNGPGYYRHVAGSAVGVGVVRSTIVVAPHFLTEADVDAYRVEDDVPFWSSGGWKEGAMSRSTTRNPRAFKLSSFAVVDAILARLADRDAFPELTDVVVTGFSAGGQFTNRFLAGSTLEPQLRSLGIAVKYVVGSPSSYLYFDEARRVAGTIDQFAMPDEDAQAQCPTYDGDKYGLADLNTYLREVGADQIRTQYTSRRVVYLLGGADAQFDEALDTGCEAQLQGEHRLERGDIYYNYLGYVFGPPIYHRQVKEIVPGVGHSARAMYSSSAAQRHLFDADVGAIAEPLVVRQ